MNDIIINLNFKRSTEQKILVETFTGIIKHIKKKTYSGPLKSNDILGIEKCRNIDEVNLRNVKDIFRSLAQQVSKNSYIFNKFDIIELLSLLTNLGITIYCITDSKSLNEVDECIILKSEDFTYNNDELKIIEITSKHFKYYCDNILFVFYLNKLYYLELQDLQQNDKLFTQIEGIEPIPIFYLDINTKNITGRLCFSYNGFEVRSNSKETHISTRIESRQYLRNIGIEKKFLDVLKESEWTKSLNNLYTHSGINLLDSIISKLLNYGFKIYFKDNKEIKSSASVSINISYNMDWFELNLESNGNDLTHLIDFKSKKRYIELDNQIILLPDVLVQAKSIFNKDNNRLIASKKEISHVVELISQSKINSNFDIDKIMNWESIDIELPKNLSNILRPYQIDGVKWLKYLYKNSFGGCLADDMGLGKTLQTIAFLSDKQITEEKQFKALIILPKTLIANWKNEFYKFNSSISINVYHGSNRDEALEVFKVFGGILLSTYNTISLDIEKFEDIDFSCAIFDEVQYIKNSNSKTYKSIKKIKSKVNFALSGTPFENNIGELWAIMDLINANSLGSKTKFIQKYKDIYDKDILSKINLRIKPFVLRRLKKDVLKELPEKFEQTIVCSMNHEQHELYNTIQDNIKNEMSRLPDKFEIKDASILLEGLLYLRQVCCHPKLLKKEYNYNNCAESEKFELFKSYIENLQESNKKVVVFSQFTEMLGIMKSWANTQGYTNFYLDGKTINRQLEVDNFENSDKGIFFISLKAGGVGLNILSSQYVIIYDLWWNPAVENQAADRVYRIGQKKDVFIYKFITENTIEQKIQALQEIKGKIGDSLFENTSQIHQITLDDMKKLIE